MRAKRLLIAIVAVAICGIVAFFAIAWRSSIAGIQPPARSDFSANEIERGAQLAAIGNCITCHTRLGGKPFAGARPMPTPFGTIYSSNITPDPESGIGRWSDAAFARALREGVDRYGRHLYPAFPFDHFIEVTDDDARALYAFLMTREPVSAGVPPNDLPFPLNIRMVMAGWKLLFLRSTPFHPDTAYDAAWNRGGYLVEGLAHCGACHTPRNVLGAEERSRRYAGGDSEGWDAPPLDGASPAPTRWSADDLYAYLHSGFADRHGAPAGPMAPVMHNLAQASDGDVRAIAIYVASMLPGAAPAVATVARTTASSGPAAAIFSGACGGCHDAGGGAIDLKLSTAVNAADPRNAIRVVLNGIHPREGEQGAFMPGFGEALSDDQTAELLTYVRGRFSQQPAWTNIGDRLHRIRSGDNK